MPNACKPLDNFPLLHSSSLEEVREAFARICAKTVLMPTGGSEVVNAKMNSCPINNVLLFFSTYGVDAQLTFPETGYFLQFIPLRGNGELIIGNTATPLTPGTAVIISSDTAWQLQSSADYEHLGLKIDAQTLTRKLEATLGASIGKALRIEAQQDRAGPRAAMLPRYVRVLVDMLGNADPGAPLPAWWRAQSEQLLITMLLCCNRHNYSHMLEEDAADAAPADVRRAEDYVVANWRQPIMLDDLTTVTGVGRLSLFHSFRKYRGYSPQEFLTQIRARRAGRLQ